MSGYRTMQRLEQDARQWIRRKSYPAFKATGTLKFNVSTRWWQNDGYSTLWLVVGDITEDAQPFLVAEMDDGPKKDADKRFHVDQFDPPGSSSWEIDQYLNAPLRIVTGEGGLAGYSGNLSDLVNALLFISKVNVENNGINASGVLAGKLMPQEMRGDVWDYRNGPCPERRWYYRPWGRWSRGQTFGKWDQPCWLKPIPLFGQLVDPELVSSYTDVDVDMDGNPLKV